MCVCYVFLYVSSHVAWYKYSGQDIVHLQRQTTVRGKKKKCHTEELEEKEKKWQKVKGERGEPRKNNRSMWLWPPMFPSVKLLCECVCVCAGSQLSHWAVSCWNVWHLIKHKCRWRPNSRLGRGKNYCSFLVCSRAQLFSLLSHFLYSLMIALPPIKHKVQIEVDGVMQEFLTSHFAQFSTAGNWSPSLACTVHRPLCYLFINQWWIQGPSLISLSVHVSCSNTERFVHLLTSFTIVTHCHAFMGIERQFVNKKAEVG